jgi:hypothetical protein
MVEREESEPEAVIPRPSTERRADFRTEGVSRTDSSTTALLEEEAASGLFGDGLSELDEGEMDLLLVALEPLEVRRAEEPGGGGEGDRALLRVESDRRREEEPVVVVRLGDVVEEEEVEG